jgi:hypothetical protein
MAPVGAGAGAAGARLDSSAAAAAAAAASATSVLLCEALGVELEQLASVDREGRALITDHGPFLLVNLYGACSAPARSPAELLL